MRANQHIAEFYHQQEEMPGPYLAVVLAVVLTWFPTEAKQG